MQVPRYTQSGLTLIETLVTIALTAAVLATITTLIVFFYRTNANVLEQSGAITSARRGIENATRDLREATIAEDGSYPIVLAEPNEVIFYADVDADPLVERVRYVLVDGVLTRYVRKATGNPLAYDGEEKALIVSEHVRNSFFEVPVFQYFNHAGELLPDSASALEVAFVTMTLVVNINPARAPEEFTLTSSATLRNLRLE